MNEQKIQIVNDAKLIQGEGEGHHFFFGQPCLHVTMYRVIYVWAF